MPFPVALASALLAGVVLSCSLPEPAPLPPNSFAFAIFGDGPYRVWEEARYRRVVDDINRSDVDWLIHVGDIFWYPCSNRNFERALAAMNTVQCPVVYTPGDNEWTDCHEPIAGGHDPLERLEYLRRVFFPTPGRTLGAHPMRVDSQAGDSTEFIENVRWVRGGIAFATVHMVGSDNGTTPNEHRTPAVDAEVARRTAAGVSWLEETFAIAHARRLRGVVLAMHGDPGVSSKPEARRGYGTFVTRLEELTAVFPGFVVLIHGDSHIQRVDKPLLGRPGEVRFSNFTRLETFGSPDIGWVRVVVDTVAGRVVDYQPRLMKRWWLL